MTTGGAVLILALTAHAASPPPWPGDVRVEGIDDTVLAWDVVDQLETRAGAWYQRVLLLRVLRPAETLDADQLERDRAEVERYLRARGYPEATVAVERRPGRPDREDIVFLVSLGPEVKAPRSPRSHPVGWSVQPLVSALGLGTPLSVYGGVHAEWWEDQAAPRMVEMHGEVGARAFIHPSDLPFGGNVGTWSDLHVAGRLPVAGPLDLLGRVGSLTDLWPGYNEARPELRAGIGVGREAVALELLSTAGVWTSWAWPAQQAVYAPWFDAAVAPTGRRVFVPSYGYARLDLALIVDTTDRPVLPRQGVRLVLRGSPMGVASGASLRRGEVEARAFLPLIARRWIAIGRGWAGVVDWGGPEEAGVLGERLFLGAVDLRAWGWRWVVPPGYDGRSFDLRPGGDLLLYADVELRADLRDDLSIGAFVDTGRVWDDPADLSLDDLLFDTGFTVSVDSPLGSVRLDVPWRLNRQPIDLGPSFLPVPQLWLDMPW